MKNRITKIYSLILIGIFLSIISIQLINNIFGIYKSEEISKSENRTLAKMPNFKLAKLDPFPQAYETWYNDHFIYRENILKWYNLMNYNFNKSPFPEKVVLGVDKWLFYNIKESDLYKGKFMVSDDSIQMIVNELLYRKTELEKRNIKFYVLIVPIKAEIYPEYLPKYIKRTKNKTLTDKIIESIKLKPEINLITCKEELIEAKKSNNVYYKNDNHWNDFGAYITYLKLINKISKDFPILKKNIINKIHFKEDIQAGGNLANMISLDYLLNEKNNKITIENAKSKDAPKRNYPVVQGFGYANEYEIAKCIPDNLLPKAVIIRDSFFGALLPFVSENFSHSVYIFDKWQYKFNLDIIEIEKPDIVILQMYEPHISNILQYLSYNNQNSIKKSIDIKAN